MTTNAKDDRAALLQRAIRQKRAAAGAQPSALPARPVDAPTRLGEMQRSLWLAHRMEPSSAAYNLVSAYRPAGTLDLSLLQRSLNEVVSRHRILRSTFRADGEEVLQVVSSELQLAVEEVLVEVGGVPEAARRAARRPFDLASAPLIRMALVREQSGPESLLLLIMHHILADERSLGLLWGQIASAYRRGAPDAGRGRDGAGSEAHRGHDGQALAGGPQYDDYVHWLAGTPRSERARELDYWRRRLVPLPDDLIFPFEGAAGEATLGEAGAPRGRLLSRALPGSVYEGTRRLAAATGATPFMVCAFTFRLLLERYLEGQNVAYATPVSTRSHPATAEMIGYFLNPLVVCASIDEDLPVEDSIRAFAAEMRDLLSHATVPFDVLAAELSPPRRPDRHPMCQVMFVYQETSEPPDLGGVRLRPVELDLGESKFDLTLFVSSSGSSFTLAVEYRADRFDEVWMQNLLGHYETLLLGLAEDAGRSTADVPMLAAAEQRQIGEWQGASTRRASVPVTSSIRAAEALLPQEILQIARRCANTPAVTCDGVHWSYDRLEKEARSVARELRARGTVPGDRVGLFMERSHRMVAGVLGIHWAGAAYVPLDPAYPVARTGEVLEDAEVAAVVTTSRLKERLPAGAWSTLCLDLIGDDSSSSETPSPLEPGAPAYILYTSGSTGRPKGVVVSHENLRASTAARRTFYESPPGRFLLLPSVAFDSSVAGIFWVLSTGGTLVVPTDEEARDAQRLAGLVSKEEVSSLLCVPSLYGAMLRIGGEQLRGLEVAIVAGESCTSQLVGEHFRALPRTRLFNEYGPTEATVWATVHQATLQDTSRPVAIGRPIPGVRVEVLDRRGRPVPAGIPGQGWIAGPTVSRGYWRRDDLTAQRFVAGGPDSGDRMYRSGDVMSWTADGRLLFLGREDDQIKLRGFRIEPGEIEAALLEDPRIEEVAVVARGLGSHQNPDSEASKHLVAFVRRSNVERTRPGVDRAESSDRDVDSFVGGAPTSSWGAGLENRLPEFMMPRRYVELPEFARLPNGKTDRNKLRDMVLQEEAAARESERPANDREQAISRLWEGLLGRSGFGVNDNFFELGGHSLLVVEMTLSIERDHGVILAAADVFQAPTVRQVAQLVERHSGAHDTSYEHLFPIQPGGRKAPFIVSIPHFFSEMLASRFRGERPVYGLRGVGLRVEGNRGRWRTMTELAENLVEEVLRRFPGDAFFMAGYSFGASMAFEAVRVMEARGIPVRRLYLIAPMPLDFYRIGPIRLQLDGLRKPVEELSFGEAVRLFWRDNNPSTRRPYGRAWRMLAVQPWRRLLCAIGGMRRRFGLPLTPRILHADVRLERFRLHRNYRPAAIRTPTVIFNAREPDTDAAATWRPYFDGPLTVCETPDPHLGEASVAAAREVILHHLEDLEKT